MTFKVFITGVTGYIGGDALAELVARHPDWEYTGLVRTAEKGAKVSAAYPTVRIAVGSLDDATVIEQESAKADVVLHTADSADHAGSARAIHAGLARGHSPQKPGYWIHISGTGILTWKDSKNKTYGEPTDEFYDDLDRVDELTHLPDDAFHRDVDKIVLGAGERDGNAVKVAIVCPPTIYGTGRGPGNKQSRQINDLVRATLERGKVPIIGRGLAAWNNVHVHDLSGLFVLLAEAAAAGNTDPSVWGAKNGYYLAENGTHAWGDVSRWVAEAAAAAGYIPAAETEPISAEDSLAIAGWSGLSWGLNSRGRARRARELLGWAPRGASLREEVPSVVETEHKAKEEKADKSE